MRCPHISLNHHISFIPSLSLVFSGLCLSPCRVLQQGSIDGAGRKVNVSHDGATNEHIASGALPTVSVPLFVLEY